MAAVGGNSSSSYEVRVSRRERVSAALPMQEHWLPLSNLDLLLPPLDVGVFFCYHHHHMLQQQHSRHNNYPATTTTFPMMVSALKASLAKVLVTYYPFAGEVVTSLAGEPELLCNNRGVDFIEAHADHVELAELHLYDPDHSVDGKLVPKKKDGVLCVQVTELKCGGVVIGCTFDHRAADAYSANMFFVAWAETAQFKPISAMPSFRRSLLSPRRPGCPVDPIFDRLYVPISSLPPPPSPRPSPSDDEEEEESLNRIYYITADVLEHMQAAASAKRSSSKLEAFSAYLWRIIGKGATKVNADVSQMGIVVDGRSRLGVNGVPMDNYFGNVLSIPYASLGVNDLDAMELSEVADTVHELLREAVTGEHFQGLIDWVEGQRPEPLVARIYCQGPTAFVVSSGQRFPVGKVDFGWGMPVLGSYHFPWGRSAGYVMPMPSPRGNGDWVVYLHLSRTLVEVLEAEAGEVFRRLAPEHLFAAPDHDAIDTSSTTGHVAPAGDTVEAAQALPFVRRAGLHSNNVQHSAVCL